MGMRQLQGAKKLYIYHSGSGNERSFHQFTTARLDFIEHTALWIAMSTASAKVSYIKIKCVAEVATRLPGLLQELLKWHHRPRLHAWIWIRGLESSAQELL